MVWPRLLRPAKDKSGARTSLGLAGLALTITLLLKPTTIKEPVNLIIASGSF
jgi:hypothetical protein